MDVLKVFSYDALLVWTLGFIVVSLMVERGLYQIFQTKLWRFLEKELDERVGGDYADLKPWISIVVCLYVAFSLELDLPAFLFNSKPDFIRIALTGLLLSGGSTAIMWIFRRAGAIKSAAHQAKLGKINGSNDSETRS